MLYDITLRITYTYDNDADASRQIIRLMPMNLSGEQRLIAGSQTVQPTPRDWINRVDFFGNNSVELAFTQAHHDIVFLVQSRVERLERGNGSPSVLALSALAAEIENFHSLEPWAPHHFLGPSPRVPIEPATMTFSRDAAGEHPDVLEAVTKIGSKLHRDMRYDPKATTVETPMLEAFNGRHGVCQDYAHVMISCLRGIGIPAGYVSGFLRTTPPPGKPRLEGADAMHAWVRAWCGRGTGWVEYDPTNGVLAGSDHVVVARGRDYSDVAPIKGIMRTHGKHTSKQSVDVIPVTPPAP